jgi:hypothetical protein
MGLKRRLGGVSMRRRKTTKPAFVELVTPSRRQLEEYVIECDSSGGMRIHWKTTAAPDWANLLRAWRDVER